jgi:hypothetical protein
MRSMSTFWSLTRLFAFFCVCCWIHDHVTNNAWIGIPFCILVSLLVQEGFSDAS